MKLILRVEELLKMTSKHSIVQLEEFVKLVSFIDLPQLSGSGDVHVLSRNPDGTKRTVWGPLLFRPSGVVIRIHHPDKPQRRSIEGPSLHQQLRSGTLYRKEWVTDERWHNPAIRLEFKAFPSKSVPRAYLKYVFVFCFDTFHDDAGVCHWIIDTLYLDVFGLEDIIFHGEDGGKWNLSAKEATLWVEEIVVCSYSKRVDTMQVGQNLFTDSPTPLIWGPPLSSMSIEDFEAVLRYLSIVTWRTKCTITGPDPSMFGYFEIVMSIDKVKDSRSICCGHGCIVKIGFILEVKANVRKIILTYCSFKQQ